MRIMLVPSAYHPSLGGVEELTKQLALHYHKKGHEVCVVTSRPPNTKSKEVIQNIPVYRMRFHLPAKKIFNVLRFIVSYPIEIKRYRKIIKRFKPDIIHIQCSSSNTLYATLVSKITKIPLILTSQGETKMDAHQIYQKSALMRWIIKYGLKQASFVTACSQATLDDLNQNFADIRHKSSVIFNGIDPTEFEGKIKLNSETYIFTTGRLSYNKGFDLLIEAFSKIPQPKRSDIKLFIGGAGEYESELKNKIIECNIQNSVTLLGRLDREQTVYYMKNALFVVMPSRYEPFGIVALEGLAAGKAVIVTKHGGPPEFIKNEQHGYVIDPLNIPEFTKSLETMLKSYKKFETKNQVYAKTWNWDKLSEMYLAIYQKIQANG